MLEREKPSGAPEAGLHLVADEQRAVLAAQRLSPGEVPLRRQVDALALDWLDDEGGDFVARKLSSQRIEIAEGDTIAAWQERSEAVAELLVAVQRERAEGQAVEGVACVEDARAPGRRARQLDRGLDRLRAGVGRNHRHDPLGRPRDQLLREQARKHADAELRQVGAVGVEQLVQRGDHVGVVAPDREGAVARQQVEVAVAPRVDQVRALAARPGAVEAERAHDPPELGVQVAVVELHRIAGAGGERLGDPAGERRAGWVGGHGPQPTRAVETTKCSCYTYFSFVSR